MRLLARAVDRLGSLSAAIAALGVLAMVALMAAGVFFRYALGHALIWVDEAVRYVLVFSVMLTVADVVRRGENIRVDLLLGPLGPRARRAVEVAGLVAALVFALALAWLGMDMVQFSLDLDMTTAGEIDIQAAWVQSALPIGGLLLTLATAVRLWRVLRGEPVEEPGGDAPAGSDRE